MEGEDRLERDMRRDRGMGGRDGGQRIQGDVVWKIVGGVRRKKEGTERGRQEGEERE